MNRLIVFALILAASHASAQSVVLQRTADTAARGGEVAQVTHQGELHVLKARFERQRVRDLRRTGGSVEPVMVDGMITLPPIEITATETSAPQPTSAERIKKNVDDAFGPERVRVAIYNEKPVIRGTPPIGASWAAWTDPGNIHFWLR
jgi:hypothetical protein